jgi:hypothetical protein
MSTYSVAPLVAVGWEGFFGILSILLLTPLPFIFPSIAKHSPFFDLPRGWQHTVSNPTVLASAVAIAFSIGFFNFFGLSVTRHVSATARSVTDTCRTITIWIVSLGLGWEVLVWPYSVLQVAGFGLLVYVLFPSSGSLVLVPGNKLQLTGSLSLPLPSADTVPSSSTTSSRPLRVSGLRSPSQKASTSPFATRRMRKTRWTRRLLYPLIWARAGTMSYPRRPIRRTMRGKSGRINFRLDACESVCVPSGPSIHPSEHYATVPLHYIVPLFRLPRLFVACIPFGTDGLTTTELPLRRANST